MVRKILASGNYTIKQKVRVVSLACDTPTSPPLHLYQILSYYLNKYGSYGLHEISASGEITTSEESESCIIKICLGVSKLRSAHDFGFRGSNYIIKKVRVVSLASDMPTGPPLHFYKRFSKYVLGYQVMECTRLWLQGRYITKKKVSCLLHVTCLLVLLFISTKYYHIISNSMGVMACTIFLLQGRQLHNKESELSLLHVTRLLVLLFIPIKYHQIISNSMGVMTCTRFRIQGR